MKRPPKTQPGLRRVIEQLNSTMDCMQADPELECVDTLSMMEDTISNTLYYFTGKRRTTRNGK